MGSSLLHRDAFYIGGAWVAPCGEETLTVVSPSTEEAVGSVPVATPADVDRAVDAASRAFTDGPWPRMAPSERAGILARAAELLAERTPDIVAVTTDEMGCAISQAPQAQTGLVAPLFRYYSELLGSFELERMVVSGERAGLVTLEPVGVVAAIVPWNAPVTLAAWKTAPALAAGCTVVLKPAPEAPLSNFVLAEVLDEAGVPPGVFNVVPAGREVGEHLVTHPGVDKVAFTGSTAAGKRIMGLCADRMTRLSLELGGKSAALVLDDADLAVVVPRVVHGVMHLSGQVCGAQTRVLVPRRCRRRRARDRGGDGVEHRRRRPPRPRDRGRTARRGAAAGTGRGLRCVGGRRRRAHRGGWRASGAPPPGVVRGADDPRRRGQLHARRP